MQAIYDDWKLKKKTLCKNIPELSNYRSLLIKLGRRRRRSPNIKPILSD